MLKNYMQSRTHIPFKKKGEKLHLLKKMELISRFGSVLCKDHSCGFRSSRTWRM